MESIITTFHIDWKIIIAQAINFGVVFVVLYIFALKPLMKIMKERTEKIDKGIKDAKQNAEVLSKTKEEYEEVLNKARAEAHTLFQEGKKDAEAKRLEMLEKTKEEVSLMVENGKKNLESEKTKMVEEVKKEITDLSVKIAEKIISQKIDGSFDEKTIKELNNLSQ